MSKVNKENEFFKILKSLVKFFDEDITIKKEDIYYWVFLNNSSIFNIEIDIYNKKIIFSLEEKRVLDYRETGFNIDIMRKALDIFIYEITTRINLFT